MYLYLDDWMVFEWKPGVGAGVHHRVVSMTDNRRPADYGPGSEHGPLGFQWEKYMTSLFLKNTQKYIK